MRYISAFSGIEAASCAWEPLGWKAVAFSEIDPFPCAVLRERYPDVPNLGDISKIDWSPYRGDVDVFVGGSPCFPAGALVVTRGGVRQIHEIRVGDEVLTHKGRFRKVLATGRRHATTVMVDSCGTRGIECTPNHPFLSDGGEWVEAARMSGRRCLNVAVRERVDDDRPPEFFYLAGRWLTSIYGSGELFERAGDAAMAEAFESAGIEDRKVVVDFADSLIGVMHEFPTDTFAEMGDVSVAREMPTSYLMLDDRRRRSLYDGVMDGCCGFLYSYADVVAVKVLAASLGIRTAVSQEGVGWRLREEEADAGSDDGVWDTVSSVSVASADRVVYNLEVEDDNSYTVDGVAVHNCQSFSITGKRTGLAGASGLMWEWCRAVDEIRPRYCVWENVPGALSSSKGEDFRCLLSFLDERGYGVAWRVLDSQFVRVRDRDGGWFGPVAQRRRRLFLVGCPGDAERAGKVLFEQGCLSGDNPSSRKKREELAADSGRRPQDSGWSVNTANTNANGSNLSDAGVAYTLDRSNSNAVVYPTCVAFAQNTRDEVRIFGGDGESVGAICAEPGAKQQCYVAVTDVVGTLCARDHKGPCADDAACGKLVIGDMRARRLTPTELERLMCFPDGWTAIPWKGRPAEECPDAPRVKALGNSMAVNVMRWIGNRIDEVEAGER